MPRRSISLIIFFLLISFAAQPQSLKVDSLKIEYNRAKNDIQRINILINIGNEIKEPKASFYYYKKALKISKENDYKKGQLLCLYNLATNHSFIGNYSKSLELYLQSLQIAENIQDVKKTLWIYQCISSLYDDMENYQKAFEYAYKGYKVGEKTKFKSELCNLLWCCGFYQFEMKNCEKSLHYFQKCHELALKMKSENYFLVGLSYLGLAMVNSCLDNKTIAYSYFSKSEYYLKKIGNDYYLMLNNQYKALYLKDNKEIDSSIVYFNKANEEAKKINYVRIQLDNYNNLAFLYSEKDKGKSIEYFKLATKLRDSIFDYDKKNEIENLTLNEQERQEKITEQVKEKEEKRKQNIQYSIIFLSLITFIILVLIFTHTIIVNTKTIRFLGIVALLLIFEFINLLIHPFLEKITHHSPILMLLCLVVFAFMLVPLHHSIEKWAVHKLINRNELTRKKIAQKLLEKEIDINNKEQRQN